MTGIDELRRATAAMAVPALLRHLMTERFPGRCVITSSLRARSVVVLKMIADIDRAAPVIFCHASYVYPESVDYRARIVRLLGLANARDPEADEGGVLPGDEDHHEIIRTEVSGGGEIESRVALNRSLAACDCWISAGYHRPYSEVAPERLSAEGRLVRVDPLAGWSQEQVRAWMDRHDLPSHPLIASPTYHY